MFIFLSAILLSKVVYHLFEVFMWGGNPRDSNGSPLGQFPP